MKFQAIKRSGKLDINWDQVNTYALRWKDGTSFDVEIKRHEAKKSDPMRKYFFGVVLPTLSRHLGYDPHEDLQVHEQLKIRYFKIEPDKRGIYRDVPSVFGDLSDKPISEKNEYVEWVKRIAAQYGCYISDPGEK